MNNINYKRIALLSILFIASIPAFSQFRVIGYIRVYNEMLKDVKTINLDQINNLNIAFLNPEPSGEFKDYPELDGVVKMAHQHNVKVLIACGGGSRHVFLDSLLADRNRARVVKNFIDFVDKYNLDGIDVDIENDDINTNYESFVVELGGALHKKHKVISAALAYSTRNKITEKALNTFDFVNLMAYDKTAPWRPNQPGQHSPYSMAQDQITYWKIQRGLAKDKINIGVPFYGYGFGPSGVSSMSFEQIINAYPDAYKSDEFTMNGGGTMYYNGFKTIRDKTILAQQETGGIMIWQLLGDAKGDNSLLNQIHQTVMKK
jgi:chitinase